jgi:hypothetical protein
LSLTAKRSAALATMALTPRCLSSTQRKKGTLMPTIKEKRLEELIRLQALRKFRA